MSGPDYRLYEDGEKPSQRNPASSTSSNEIGIESLHETLLRQAQERQVREQSRNSKLKEQLLKTKNKILTPTLDEKKTPLNFLDIRDIYYYYYGKGFFTILLSRIAYLLMIVFGITLASLLMFFLQYNKLFNIDIAIENGFAYPTGIRRKLFLATIYISGIILIGLIIYSGRDLRKLWGIRQYYLDKLRVKDRELDTMTWKDISKRLENCSDNLHYVNPDDIAQAVMKRDNYLIAMINNRVFDGPEIDPSISRYYDIIHSTLFFSSTFDWIFDNIIFPAVIPEHFGHSLGKSSTSNTSGSPGGRAIRLTDSGIEGLLSTAIPESAGQIEKSVEKSVELIDLTNSHEIIQGEHFLDNMRKIGHQERIIDSLNRKLRFIGFLGIFLCPIIVAAIVIYSFFRYTEELRNRPEHTFTSRQWSRYSRYRFRKFNELPHDFEYRLNSGMSAANLYLRQFYSGPLTIVGKLGSFIFASFLAILLTLAFIDESIILDKIFIGKTLLWWSAIIGTLLTFFRALAPPRHAFFDPWSPMADICQKIDLPESWKDSAHDRSVQRQFSHFFPHRIVIFLHEIMSVILLPYFSIFFLPRCSRKIVSFLSDQTAYSPHIGPVCQLSLTIRDVERGDSLKEKEKADISA